MTACPTYMMYGMTYDEFWFGDPWLAYFYREAYKARRQEENIRDWLQGAYFYNAVSVALANGFRKKGARQQNYMEEPIRIFKMTADEKREQMEKEKANAEAWMRSLAAKQHSRNVAQEQQHGETGNTGTRDSSEDTVNLDDESQTTF